MKSIYTKKNFLNSLLLGSINIVVYYLAGFIFKVDRKDWMFYVVMFFTFFLINFFLRNGNRHWKEFLTLKKRND